MSSEFCGACNLIWHTKRDIMGGVSGQIWVEGIGYHPWQAPTKEQITARLRAKYGLIPEELLTYLHLE
jgi:hypothetical protein